MEPGPTCLDSTAWDPMEQEILIDICFAHQYPFFSDLDYQRIAFELALRTENDQQPWRPWQDVKERVEWLIARGMLVLAL